MGSPCVYCGSTEDLTVDHVPPKCVFPPTDRGDILSVPSCRSCNNGFSLDDEYFRDFLAIKAGPDEGATDEILERMFRSMERDGFEHKFDYLLERLEPVVADGERRVAFHVDTDRIARVAKRIARALFFLERGDLQSGDIELDCTIYGGMKDQPKAALEALGEAIKTMRANVRQMKSGQFAYVSAIDPHDPRNAAWVLEFYGGTQIVVRSRPAH